MMGCDLPLDVSDSREDGPKVDTVLCAMRPRARLVISGPRDAGKLAFLPQPILRLLQGSQILALPGCQPGAREEPPYCLHGSEMATREMARPRPLGGGA